MAKRELTEEERNAILIRKIFGPAPVPARDEAMEWYHEGHIDLNKAVDFLNPNDFTDADGERMAEEDPILYGALTYKLHLLNEGRL